MSRPRITDEFIKVPPKYGELIERMLHTQEAIIFDASQVKTLAKIKNAHGIFDIVQPEYIEPNRTPKKIVKTGTAEIVTKTPKYWLFKV